MPKLPALILGFNTLLCDRPRKLWKVGVAQRGAVWRYVTRGSRLWYEGLNRSGVECELVGCGVGLKVQHDWS